MDEEKSMPSEDEKKKYYNKFILIGKLGQLYIDNGKMIKCLIKQLKRERKYLNRSRYPLTDQEKRDIAIALTELSDILTGFLHSSDLERYNISVQSLKNYISKFEKELNMYAGISAAKKALDIAKDTARNLGEKIGKGVEEVKKTVQGITSK